MTARIRGPLRAWYDLHEALAFEIGALVGACHSLAPATADAFMDRFSIFARELRAHSEVEDGIMFAALRARGGQIGESFGAEHHHEQQLIYDARCALLEATTLHHASGFTVAADILDEVRRALLLHFEAEEDRILPQVPLLFDDQEQATLLRTIITSVPAGPDLQAWVASRLTPEHREGRLRNMAQSLPPEQLVVILHQIHQGVNSSIWADIEARVPELAALALP
jgi:hemerythrin superfamily protein